MKPLRINKKGFFCLLTAVWLLAGCSAKNPTAPNNIPSSGKMSFAIQAESNVVSGKVTISKGAIILNQAIAISNSAGSVTFSSIQVGKWTIMAQLYDATGAEIYSGTGEATVNKDQTTTLKITVTPSTGNLQITIDLGTPTFTPTVIATVGQGTTPTATSTRTATATVTPTSTATPGQTQGLVLWNKLGSLSEVLNSAYGPGLKPYDPSAPLIMGSSAMVAYPAYNQGVFGNATTVGSLADYSNPNRSSCVFELDNPGQVLNPEHGTIEFWYKQNGDPTFGQSGALFVVINTDIDIDSYHKPYNFRFALAFGNQWVILSTDISPYNNTWIHMAAVWDRSGIQGSSDAMRLYINGNLATSTSQNNWGTVITQSKLGVMGGVDTGVVDKWGLDNLKIYNRAKTDFSDRFQE